ncbi:MAG: hypothetical protein LBB79_06100 [Prevotellaceae bacterium]|jgi:hypothetical protein|nr:hypothetical protein [Prevotellaceae bacterium]
MENDSENDPLRDNILQMLKGKALEKQRIYDNTFEIFQLVKEALHELANEMNEELQGLDKRVKLEYRDRGQYEAEIRVAGDILVFSMHSNVFQFDRSHIIWKTPYAKQSEINTYCGMINIYNFLTDSFRLNRLDDLGYLVGRIFINRDNRYFVEGKRQMSFTCHSFGSKAIDKDSVRQIAETAIQYSLNFDLLVPPYDAAKIVSVGQINNKIEDSKIQTGKRLGFQFNSDDVVSEAKPTYSS